MTGRKPASYEDDAASTVLDGRQGNWSKLELLRMDARFCEAVRRAHSEPLEPTVSSADPERRRRA